MKKIKFILVAMIAFLASASFTACSDDEGSDISDNSARFANEVLSTVQSQKKKDKALLLVAFGSTWQQAYDAFDNTVAKYKEEFPDYDVYMSFSSDICVNRAAAGENTAARSFYQPNYWLSAFGKVQYSEIVVQSLQVIPGEEYGRVVNYIKSFGNNSNRDLDDEYLSKVKVYLGTPLMATTNDVGELAGALDGVFKDKAKDSYVLFMGHGNPDKYDTYSANVRYTQLEDSLQKLSTNYYVGTVDMSKNFKVQVRNRMVADGHATGSFYLQALMSIAGDHANNDMAGIGKENDADKETYKTAESDPEDAEVDGASWLNYFEHYSYTYKSLLGQKDNGAENLQGLLEIPSVLQLWINHTKAAIAGDPEDIYHSMNPEE